MENNIKDILDRANGTTSVEKSGGAIEFEFAKDDCIVFETEEAVELIIEDNEPKAEEAPPLILEDVNTEDEKRDGEFLVPDTFSAPEELTAPTENESSYGIWSTYVPRFTEVSETYRMADDKRPRQPVAQKPEDRPCGDVIDPTAETDVAEDIGIVVSLDTRTADADTKTVYKFANTDAPKTEAPRPRTVEDEVREISELMGTQITANEDSAAEESAHEAPIANEDVANTEIPESLFADVEEKTVKEEKREMPEREAEATPPDTISKKALALPRSEFSAPPQRDRFKDRFLDQLLSVKVRAVAIAMLALVLLAFENLSVLGVNIYSPLGIPKHTGFPALLDFLVAVGIFILTIPEIIISLRLLTKKQLTSEISLILSLLVVGVYSITIFVSNIPEYPLFGFLFAVHAMAALYAAHSKRAADFENFKIITSKDEKSALELLQTKELPEENMALDGAVDEYNSKLVRSVNAAFITDFFKRSGRCAESSITTVMLMSVSAGIALVTGVVAFFLGNGVTSLVTALALVFLLSMPAFSVLTHKIPYFFAARAAKREGIAILGEASFEEYAEANVVVYEDTEIFGTEDVNLRSFSGDMTKGMKEMSALFSAVGGPLDYIFANALDKKTSPAQNVTVEEDGIIGKLDGRTIMAGSEEFMERHGATFLNESLRVVNSAHDSAKVMYAADNGIIYAHFRIRYSFSEAFTMLLPTLKDEKIVPLIVTRDPNINNELIKKLTAGQDVIRVLKKSDVKPEGREIARKISTGVVTLGDEPKAMGALLLAKKYSAFCSRLAVTELLSMAVGAALGVVLALGGMSGAPSGALGLWQLLWCIGIGLLSYREFSESKEKSDENDL